jgi:peptidoglycan hydrolase CwlO-like protein
MKKSSFVIIMLALVQVSSAGALVLENYNITGDHVLSGDYVYKILYKTETFFDGKSIVRLIVEDYTKVENLEEKLENLTSEKQVIEQKIVDLAEEAKNLNKTLANAEGVLNIIERQKADLEGNVENLIVQISETENEIKELQSRRDSLESSINANLLVSPTLYRISVTVFIILLLTVLVTKGKDIFSFKKKK